MVVRPLDFKFAAHCVLNILKLILHIPDPGTIGNCDVLDHDRKS